MTTSASTMTTERILPAIALPAPAARPAPARPHARTEAAARPAVRRKEALLTTPARAGMLVGASATIYAVSLAGVAGLQAQGDADLAARRQPYLDAIAQARAANDRLEAAVERADEEAQALGGFYARTGDTVAAYEARLDSLAALVAEVKGSAAALPARIGLPKVTIRSAGSSGGGGTTRSAPRTTSTSGASGG
jgi:hypothetical protein